MGHWTGFPEEWFQSYVVYVGWNSNTNTLFKEIVIPNVNVKVVGKNSSQVSFFTLLKGLLVG